MARSSRIIPASEAIGDLPSVPMRVRSLDGQVIETGANVWRMRTCSDGGDVLTINWERLRAMRRGCAFSARAEHLAPALSRRPPVQKKVVNHSQRLLNIPLLRGLALEQSWCAVV